MNVQEAVGIARSTLSSLHNEQIRGVFVYSVVAPEANEDGDVWSIGIEYSLAWWDDKKRVRTRVLLTDLGHIVALNPET